MIHQFHVNSINELEPVAIKLLELSNSNHIFAFFGPMGAGKTTLIKTFCKLLGTVDVVSSPTFSLVNEYLTETGEAVYHFDFYRIDTIEEVFDIGYE
ncbi:tRNA (adenosine(37)-N6)-threonylcarbamoyltransferase complex ATPase subunit type 1 TsaE, partial [Arthrospira platensis SPKY1]|nr:tRNA (adenosine(37)-N6)-threonylcarbamoyltransferase complex ATPase subunit type 1 TsaE [Arthrospira platensis SPKY1]